MIDKPEGVTSHDVVGQVRKALGTRAVGHTGTLDPFATGLLVVLVGRGTRLARFVEQQAKTYLATARLGSTTATDDLTGPVLTEVSGAAPDDAAVRNAATQLLGPQWQRPPVYSAKRVGGERSHRLARRGVTVELEPVEVVVHTLDVLAVDGWDVTFRTTVSPGTYVRALARDLGARLGVGAHLTALRREAIGPLRVEDAVPLDDVRTGIELVALAQVVAHLPAVAIDASACRDASHGRAIPAPDLMEGLVVLRHGDDVVAVATATEGWLKPKVVLVKP